MKLSLKSIRFIFTVVGLAYLLLPTDLLPDLLGLLGRIDDLIVVAALYWKYKDLAKKYSDSYSEVDTETDTTPDTNFDPYQVLEVSRGASKDEIEKQYRKLVAQYHPDKVEHLGEELKAVAHEKMLQIQKAYEQIA